jgi:transposase
MTAVGRAVGAELVGDDHPWHQTRVLQQAAEEAPGRGGVPPVLYEDVEHHPVLVDSPPQVLRRHLIWVSRLSVVLSIVERLVPDELWELFQRVVPEAPSRPQGGGRRRHGDREVLAAIVFVATSGCTWQQLPSASFGPSGATAHRRFAEWTKARVWAKLQLHRLVLDELGARGELDWSRCAIDSVNMRALKRGT